MKNFGKKVLYQNSVVIPEQNTHQKRSLKILLAKLSTTLSYFADSNIDITKNVLLEYLIKSPSTISLNSDNRKFISDIIVDDDTIKYIYNMFDVNIEVIDIISNEIFQNLLNEEFLSIYKLILEDLIFKDIVNNFSLEEKNQIMFLMKHEMDNITDLKNKIHKEQNILIKEREKIHNEKIEINKQRYQLTININNISIDILSAGGVTLR